MRYVQTLALSLLGGLNVDGVDLHALGSRKARTFLWLLALGRGDYVPADALIDALWPVRSPANPADQLAVLASRLRAVLGRERVEHGDLGYRLRYDWLDVDELATLVEETSRRQTEGNVVGAAAAARVAVALLRATPGDPGVAGPWVEAELAAAERLRARGRRVAAHALLTAGAWLETVEVLAISVELDPYDEDAVRLLMRADVAGGRTAGALSTYAALRERLADDLGADPSPETEALHTAILRGEVASSTPDRSRSDLVGRDEELAWLDRAAEAAGGVQLRVIEGEAGIGKTSLVRAWAAGRDTDIVIFATCGDLTRSAPLDPLFGALAAYLRLAGGERSAYLLGPDEALLAPLLGLGPAAAAPPLLADGVVGPTLLWAALTGLMARLAETGRVILVLDDAHRGGPALADWLTYVSRRSLRLVVVATVRVGEGQSLPGADVRELGPLSAADAAQIVGVDRAADLYARSGGHPLFLTELAMSSAIDGLPDSIVASVSARCDLLGRAATTLRSAAVVGSRIDLDLLAAVLNRPAVEILDDVELGAQRRLIEDDNGTFRFRHALVRAALSASVSPARSAWLNRQVARVLARRPDADPVEVAHHARLGGDVELAATSLRAASVRATERFDHATAETLLDEALALHADEEGWLARATVRTRRGHYEEAALDVDRARGLGARAAEVGAWAAYFDRRFSEAMDFADDGASATEDPELRSRCLAIGGRTRHALGDLASAENLLLEAVSSSSGADRVMASAWLGVLRAHQSRPHDAITLLRPAAQSGAQAEHTSAVLHALLFTGHAHALAGRTGVALDAFTRYTAEVERRQQPRFAGRGINFSGWVLRNVGARDEALDRHREALDVSDQQGTPELLIAVLEDLAEDRLQRLDLDGTSDLLAEAEAAFGSDDLVFGWRLGMKLDLLRSRLLLAREEPGESLVVAARLADRAEALGIPRYAVAARLVSAAARRALGEPVDLDTVAADVAALDAAVGLEAWWWTGDAAAAHGVAAWVDLAAARAAALARGAGDYTAVLTSESARRLDSWSARVTRLSRHPGEFHS
jgi:DNA-binding SARP family transcriptional activator/tetratricopeptide (TPR) repeat protein